MSDQTTGGRLGFLDSLGRLFRRGEAGAAQAESSGAETSAAFGRDFDAAIRELQAIAVRHAQPVDAARGGATRAPAADAGAERLRRKQELQRSMREDIEKMHARLGTGLAPGELEAAEKFLTDLDQTLSRDQGARELLPHLRHSIGARLMAEAGELAVARLVHFLQRANVPWPDATSPSPNASEQDLERGRKRRLADVRETFLAQDLGRTSERMWGVVQAWGADYPDRGSPLWDETVMEGVAAGIRGVLVQRFVEALRSERDALLAEAEASVGKELAALDAVMQRGVRSIEDANKAVACSLQALDAVIPDLAWKRVKAKLPEARGELAS